MEEVAALGKLNGVVLVSEGGDVIYERAIGLRSGEPGDTIDFDTQFRLGSVTLQFTALAIMQLQEAGLLDYDDPVQEHIPEWPYEGQTVRHMLLHTSGIPSFRAFFETDGTPTLPADDGGEDVAGNELVIRQFVRHQPDLRSDPGDRHRYGASGYWLLATIVARVSGMPYHVYMRDRVFLPAGMTDTHAYSSLREDPLRNRADGIEWTVDGSEVRPVEFTPIPGIEGSGRIYSTLRDMYRWDRALYTNELVSPASLELAFTPGVLNSGETIDYGFGWALADGRVHHSGGSGGTTVEIHRMLDEQSVIIVMANGGDWYGVIEGVRQILDGGVYDSPKPDGSAVLAQALLTGDLDEAREVYLDLKSRPDEYDLGAARLGNLGQSLIREGYLSEALFLHRLLADEYPGDAGAWAALADTYLMVGDTANAVSSYQREVAIWPNTPNVRQLQRLLGGM